MTDYKDSSAHFKVGYLLESLRGIRSWLRTAPADSPSVIAALHVAELALVQISGECLHDFSDWDEQREVSICVNCGVPANDPKADPVLK